MEKLQMFSQDRILYNLHQIVSVQEKDLNTYKITMSNGVILDVNKGVLNLKELVVGINASAKIFF